VSDPALARRVRAAASDSGARALDVVVLAYMKHRLRTFLWRIGYLEPDALAFVELVDNHGRFAWSAGRLRNGGMVTRGPTSTSAAQSSTRSWLAPSPRPARRTGS
jgi:hypothetical protein